MLSTSACPDFVFPSPRSGPERAVLIAVATGVERSQDGAASGAVQGQQGEFLRWLKACAQGSDGATRELAGAVLGHSSVQALAYM